MLNRNRDQRPINWRRIGLLLLAGGAVYALGYATPGRPDLDAIADAQRQRFIDEGWAPSVVVDAEDLAEVAPDIEVEVLDEIDAPPVIALNVNTDEVEIDLPNCLQTCCPIGEHCTADMPPCGSTAAPVDFFDIDESELPSVPITGQPQRPRLSANVQAIAAVDLKGRLYLNGAIKATMRLPDDSWVRTYDLPIDDDTSTVAVSDDIETALRIMVRGYRSTDWRVGALVSGKGALGFGLGRTKHWGRKWGWYVNGSVDLASVNVSTLVSRDGYDPTAVSIAVRDARIEIGLSLRHFK